MTYRMAGELKKPIDIIVDGKLLRQVYRIFGNDEYGYVYSFTSNGKRYRTSTPLWHKGHEQYKRNDMPKLNDIMQVRYIEGNVTIRQYEGAGYYKVTDEKGQSSSVHMLAFK